jgi:hypothetical protein
MLTKNHLFLKWFAISKIFFPMRIISSKISAFFLFLINFSLYFKLNTQLCNFQIPWWFNFCCFNNAEKNSLVNSKIINKTFHKLQRTDIKSKMVQMKLHDSISPESRDLIAHIQHCIQERYIAYRHYYIRSW